MTKKTFNRKSQPRHLPPVGGEPKEGYSGTMKRLLELPVQEGEGVDFPEEDAEASSPRDKEIVDPDLHLCPHNTCCMFSL